MAINCARYLLLIASGSLANAHVWYQTPDTAVEYEIKLNNGADGSFGSHTTTALQNWLVSNGFAMPVDGSFGTVTKKALQMFLVDHGFRAIMQSGGVDGNFGANSAKDLQSFLTVTGHSTPIDGNWGSDTTRKLQSFLMEDPTGSASNHIWYQPPDTSVEYEIRLNNGADGSFGSHTTTALQKWLVSNGHAMPIDGSFGMVTSKALQTFLVDHGFRAITQSGGVDGNFGSNSAKDLQSFLTVTGHVTPIDGNWANSPGTGSDTTRKLQSFLMEGAATRLSQDAVPMAGNAGMFGALAIVSISLLALTSTTLLVRRRKVEVNPGPMLG